MKDINGCENRVVYHLYRLWNKGSKLKELEIDNLFPNKQVLPSTLELVSLFIDFTNYHACGINLEDLSYQR